MNNRFFKSPCSLNLILSTAVFGIFTIFLNSSDAVAQTRKLRLAIKDLEEGKAEDANEKILKFEEKEGERPPSLYVRYLFHDKTGTGTASLDLEYQYLNDAFERLEYSPDEEAKEWCEELGFCKEKYQSLKNAAESKLLEAYTANRSLEKINEFITKYPSATCTWKAVDIRDSLEFASVCFTDKEADYQAFIKKRPSSKYVNQAREKLHTLAFARAKSDRTVAAMEEFIKSYPDANEYDSAMMLLAELKWNMMKDNYSKKDYADFCRRFKASPFAAAAASRIESEDWKDLESMPSISGYKSFISDYPGSKHLEDAKRKMKELEYAAMPYLLANGKSALYYVFKDSLSNLKFDKIVPTASGLFLVLENGKGGVIDAVGNPILPKSFDDISERYGFLIVKSGNKYGAYDLTGDKLLEASYDAINPINDTLADVSINQNNTMLHGLYKKGGGLIVTTKYSSITPLPDGRFIVNADNQYFIIDQNEKPQGLKYSGLSVTEDGYFIYQSKGKTGVLSNDLSVLIPAIHGSITKAANGFITSSTSYKYGLTDLNGKELLKPIYSTIAVISNDLLSVGITDDYPNKYKLFSFSKKGFISDDYYETFGELHEGLIAVELDGKTGFINEKGSIMVPLSYIWNFKEGLGADMEDQYEYEGESNCPAGVYLNEFGNTTERNWYQEAPYYQYGGLFSEGKAAVSNEQGFGYIDSTGQVIIPFVYSDAEAFRNGVASVTKEYNSNYEQSVIDAEGKILLKGYGITWYSTDRSRILANNPDSGFVIFDIKNKKRLVSVGKSSPFFEDMTSLSFERFGYSATYKKETVYISPSGKWLMDRDRKFPSFEKRKIYTEAYEAYYANDYDLAIEKLETIDRIYGEECESVALRSKCYIQKGDYETAGTLIGRFMEFQPEDTQLLYELYTKQQQEKEWYGLIESASKIIATEKAPSIDLYSWRGYAYGETEQYDLAIDDYDYVLSKKKDVYAFANRGNNYFRKGVYLKALGDFSVGIQNINSSTPLEIKQYLYANRGRCLYNLNRKGEACEAWKAGMNLGSSDCQSLIYSYCR